ncbi:MAG: hypothetical protein K6A37_09895 [Saccharofermentans sp.]|nr:hypothetical protein [Saccharofermentans sp.]
MRSNPGKRGFSALNALLIAVALIFIVLDAGYGIMYYMKVRDSVNEHVTIETGTPVTLDLFVTENIPLTAFITDVSLIDNMVPGTYGLKVKTLVVTRDVLLDIVDTTAPAGTAVPQTIFQDDVPDVEDTVTDVYDLAPVTVSYVNDMTAPLEGGAYDVPVRLADPYGNETIINVPFEVTADTAAPSLEVPECIYAFIGGSTSYLENVTVSDDFDPAPEVTVDLSQVDSETAGVYQITYTATDAHGNSVSRNADLILEEVPAVSLDRREVYGQAADVLYNQVLCGTSIDSFTDVEVAFRIFDWASRNISYTGTSDKSDWTIAATDGFDTHTGDCYTYYAVCRAMLDVAGIENVRVERYPITTSPHYWNLIKIDGQWYHCDACDFADTSGFVFMQIDSELDHHHEFNGATVPARASVSVQDRLDFTNLTMEDIEE